MLGYKIQQLCRCEGYKKSTCLLPAGYHGGLPAEHGTVLYFIHLFNVYKSWNHNRDYIVCLQLNEKFDPDDQHHIVRMLDFFLCQNHLCIAFEMLGNNL
jgi:hypothetical protein